MDHAQEKLNNDIRKTIADMRDEDLIHIVQSTSGEYTAFAREAARREVARRGGLDALKKNLGEGTSPKTAREPEYIRAAQERTPTAGAATGCYIDVWEDKNFEGDSLRIEGPGAIANLCSNGLAWCRRIRSLRVGPQAFVLAYGGREFKGDIIRLGPSEEVPDLGNVKFEDEIDSMRIVDSIRVFDCTCSPGEHFREHVASENEGFEGKGSADVATDEPRPNAGHQDEERDKERAEELLHGRHHRRKKH